MRLTVALVVVAALLALVAPADAFQPGKVLKKIRKTKKGGKEQTSTQTAFEPLGLDWTPAKLEKFAKHLGGTVKSTPITARFHNPLENVRKFVKSDFAKKRHGNEKDHPEVKDISFVTYDAEHATRVTVPLEALKAFAGPGTATAELKGPATDDTHFHEEVLMLEEEARVGAAAANIPGEAPAWKKITGAELAKNPVNKVVQLVYEFKKEGVGMINFCTGAVIAKGMVLTAAHCVTEFDGDSREKNKAGDYKFTKPIDLKAGKVSVLFGREGYIWNDKSTYKHLHTVKSVTVLESFSYLTYRKDAGGDIAILTLDGTAPNTGAFGFGANHMKRSVRKPTPARLAKEGDKHIHVTGYPAEAKGGYFMWCDRTAADGAMGDGNVEVRADVEEGSSGGPAWYEDSTNGMTVVGVVSSNGNHGGNLIAALNSAAYTFVKSTLKAAGKDR